MAVILQCWQFFKLESSFVFITRSMFSKSILDYNSSPEAFLSATIHSSYSYELSSANNLGGKWTSHLPFNHKTTGVDPTPVNAPKVIWLLGTLKWSIQMQSFPKSSPHLIDTSRYDGSL